MTAGAAISVAALRLYRKCQGYRMLREARRTPYVEPEEPTLDTPDGPIVIVNAHGLNWPKGEAIAMLFRSTGDPWSDLSAWRRMMRLTKDGGIPSFVIRDPVFPSPEEQRRSKQ